MFVDTHAHLSDEKLARNIEEILQNANDAGVKKIISIGCSINEAIKSISLADKYDMVYATAGLYPHEDIADSHIPDFDKLKIIELLASNPAVKAIGECGLDYKTPPPQERQRSTAEQEKLFRAQIHLARDLNLPVVIHSRYAPKETLAIVESEYKKMPFRAVWHCFSESASIAEAIIPLGFMISFTGIITYPNAKPIQEIAKKIPLQNVMIETDSPYLVPQSKKDTGLTLNEPRYVKIIAEEIAKSRNISLDEVEKVTTENALSFFNL